MIKGAFPRLFGNFKEGAILQAKFVVTNAGTPVYAFKSSTTNANYTGLAMVYDGTAGFVKLTLSGGARDITVVSILHLNIAAPTNPVKKLEPMPYVAIDATGGVIKFKFVDGTTAGEAFADPASTDEVHVILYVNK